MSDEIKYKKIFRYNDEETQKLHSEYVDEYVERYKDRILEFDLPFIEMKTCYDRQSIAKLHRKKAMSDRIQVEGVGFPVFCSPSFLEQCAVQIQEQLEKTIGVDNIHRLFQIKNVKATSVQLYMFYSICALPGDNDFYFTETEDGICYSYCLCFPSLLYPFKAENIPGMTLFWVKFWSTIDPGTAVDPEIDAPEGSVRFQICDQVPKSFPDYEHMPQYVHDYIEWSKTFKEISKLFWERLYNPDYWIGEIKEFVDYALKMNKKKSEREARRKEKMLQNKVELIIKPDAETYFPDLTYVIEFNNDMPEDTVEWIMDIMEDIDGKLGDYNMEFYDAEKTSDRICELVIDFGMCPPATIKKVAKAIEKKVPDLKSITIG